MKLEDRQIQPFRVFYNTFGKAALVALLQQYGVRKVAQLNQFNYEMALRDVELFTMCFNFKRKQC